MEDEASILLDGKALGNLRVVDLKQELEKRGLSKSGSKKDLVKRLKQQLEFEKLCGERKSTGDCDLKLELDADTEKNEFVQQYLAQQQKIYAEQKEVKRLIELEEIQRSSDERGSDSPKAEDASDQETHPDESSDNESQAEISEEKATVPSTVGKQHRQRIHKGKTEADSAIADEEKMTDSELSASDHIDSARINSVNVEAVKSVALKEEESRIEADKDEQISSENVKEESVSKESRLEVVEKEDVISVNVDESDIKESKVEVIIDQGISCVKVEDKNRNEEVKVEHVEDESMEVSRVENIKVENIKQDEIKNVADESREDSKVENIKGETMEDSRVENIADESIKEDEVENIEDESRKDSRVENMKDETMDSRVENIKDETMESRVENIKDETMDSRVENIKDEMMEDSRIENIKNETIQDSRVENIKDETENYRVENIKDETIEDSRIKNIKDETIQDSRVENIEDKSMKERKVENVKAPKIEIIEKMETDTLPFREDADKNQKDVSLSSPSVDHNPHIQKLSEKKSIEESSNTLKNHPSSLDSSETTESHRQTLDMEPATEISTVPYSVSDIQLPESPGSVKKSVSKPVPEEESTENQKPCPTEMEGHANGTDSNSSCASPRPDKQAPEPETASTLNGESPDKNMTAKSKEVADKKKEGKFSEGSEEGEMKSDSESATEESSDSNEHRRGRRKSQKVKRKRERRRSSSSSENRSKADIESKSDTQSKSVTSTNVDTPPAKQRLKLKRDNVVVSDSLHAAKKSDSLSRGSEESDTSNRKNSDVVTQPASSEPRKTEPVEVQPVPKYVSTRKIRLANRKSSEKSGDEPKGKKSKWGNFSSSQKASQAISISTDSLKNWFPDFKLLKNPENVTEAVFDDPPMPTKEESHLGLQTERMDESSDFPPNVAVKEESKVSDPVAAQPDNGGEASNILFIQNLVRPFTLLQLKDLLKETGNLIEDKFWIDKIKSKCFVTYESVEEAVKTRNALNGSRWPSSNPKILSVEFATEEDLHYHQSGSEPPKPAAVQPPLERAESQEDRPIPQSADFRKKEREPERRRERTKLPVREWDKNKLTQESPTRERASKSAERFKPADKREKKDAKRRPNEDTPAKLLDDLFQKTKSSPCIYWLPLTEGQVVEREESVRLRRVEREKRNQQREQEESEHKNKSAPSRNRTREMETRRSSTRSRSPVSRRR